MENQNLNKNKISILGDSDFSMIYDEEKIIEEAITTPFEKVLKILNNVKNFISDLEINIKIDYSKTLITDLEYVIKRIQSHTLYTYDLSGENEELEKCSQESPEIKSFLEFLSDYSENKIIKKRSTKSIKSQTVKLNAKLIGIPKVKDYESSVIKLQTPTTIRRKSTIYANNFIDNKVENETLQINIENENFNILRKESFKNAEVVNLDSTNETNIYNGNTQPKISSNRLTLTSIREIVDKESIDDKFVIEDNLEIFNKLDDDSITSINTEINSKLKKINNKSYTTNFKFEQSDLIEEIIPEQINTGIDFKSILTREFNIHEFEAQVGHARLLPIIGHTLYKTLDLLSIINTDKLESFLHKLSTGYFAKIPYHNSKHAADVAQTACIFLLNSNLEQIAILNNTDILALITSSFAHDIGHPGTNNGYQVNTYSDIAIMYGDQSVLENFHNWTFFKIVKNTDCNIFDKFSDYDFRQFRKRVIGLILATDMVYHSKIHTLMRIKATDYKEKLKLIKQEKIKLDFGSDNESTDAPDKNNGICFSNNSEDEKDEETVPFVSSDPVEFYEEQQRMLNFIIHAADLSHNSKSFKISSKWTDLLMQEFWAQGDEERKMGIQISFLCDRTTSDLPKSQIGFIKGIIIPTFDVLIDIFPTLSFLRLEIDKNLVEWGCLGDLKKPVNTRISKVATKTVKLTNSLNILNKFHFTKSSQNNIISPKITDTKKSCFFYRNIELDNSPKIQEEEK